VLLVAAVCGQALFLATRADIARRRWVLITWVSVTLMTPFLLEAAGIFKRTWEMTSVGLVTQGTIVNTVARTDVYFLAIGQTALAIAVSLFAITTTRAREQAQRKAHIQAWHLRQLIPRGAPRSTSSGDS
jgi:hypothetical protein